jgi:hypothetical protein
MKYMEIKRKKEACEMENRDTKGNKTERKEELNEIEK